MIYGAVRRQGQAVRLRADPGDLDTQSPYNTYVIDGLPPGPIANPGEASLEAVANPSRTRDLFFVADGSGGHAFAETYEEHLAQRRPLAGGEQQRASATRTRRAPDGGTGGRSERSRWPCRPPEAGRLIPVAVRPTLTARCGAVRGDFRGHDRACRSISMTGFARADGGGEGFRWIWELRSVNGKGLDVRFRLPPGFERLEQPARERVREPPGARQRPGDADASQRETGRQSPHHQRGRARRGPRSDGDASRERIDAAAADARRHPGDPRRRRGRRGRDSTRRRARRSTRRYWPISTLRLPISPPCGRARVTAIGRDPACPAGRDRETGRGRRGIAGPHAGGDPRAACRAGRDASRRGTGARPRPAAPGGCAARHQGRYPRGDRPASTPMSPPPAPCSTRAVPSAAGSTSWPRNSTAK